MKFELKPGVVLKENEMPSVFIGDIDPAYWVDDFSMGPQIAEMRRKKVLAVADLPKKKKSIKKAIRRRRKLRLV